MRIHYELDSSTRKEKIINQLSYLNGLIDRVNVPDNPMGYVKASSLAVSIFIKQLGIEPVMHIRTVDRNLLAIKSEIYGAKLFEINEILLVKGDIPLKEKFEVFNTSKLEVLVENLKEDEKIKDMKIGLPITSFSNLTSNSIARLKSKADFIVTTQVKSVEEINEEIIKLARKYKKEVHCYFIVATERNKDLLYKTGLLREEKIPNMEEYLRLFEEFESYIDALVLSSPLDVEYLSNLLNKYRKK